MILLLTEVFPPMKGGSGRWLWELYRRLPAGSVRVVASRMPGVEEFDRTHDLPMHRLPLRFADWGLFARKGAWEYPRMVRALRRLVARTGPSVIHCGKCLPEGFLAWVLRAWGGPPYWTYVHGEELTLARTSTELGWMTRQALLGAAGVVANSKHTRELLILDWGVQPDRIHVLHPGVDTQLFTPAPRDEAVRRRLGWEGRSVVLTVGALQPRKGQDMMIRAIPQILKAVPNLFYSIVGEGWERRYLQGLVAELGVEKAVQFRGVPEDGELVSCYQQCDLFTLPNRQVGWDFEGFGIVLLEAQACGKPVLAGRSGGTAETMRPGETGVVIDCSSPTPQAEAVIQLLSDRDKLARMGTRARDWAVERFNWSALVPEAAKLFGEALSASGRPRPSAGRLGTAFVS
jgi:phosphatidylinositol alpha-1,6-mannosyltransferase